MELLLLAGGAFYLAAIGFFVMDRLGRFLDNGGISPDWDGTGEAQGAGQAPDLPRQADSSVPQDGPCAFQKK